MSAAGIWNGVPLASSSRTPPPAPRARWRCAAPGPSWWLLGELHCYQPGSPRHLPSCCHPGSVRETSEFLQEDRHSQCYPGSGLGRERCRTGQKYRLTVTSLASTPFSKPGKEIWKSMTSRGFSEVWSVSFLQRSPSGLVFETRGFETGLLLLMICSEAPEVRTTSQVFQYRRF